MFLADYLIISSVSSNGEHRALPSFIIGACADAEYACRLAESIVNPFGELETVISAVEVGANERHARIRL